MTRWLDHGYQTHLASLRARHAVSLKGATLAHLMKIAAALGLQARPVRLGLQMWRDVVEGRSAQQQAVSAAFRILK